MYHLVKKLRLPALLFLLTATACRRQYEVEQPSTAWSLYDAATTPLPAGAGARLEGVYNFSDGNDRFGSDAVLKWSYRVDGTDTSYTLSVFCQKAITYMLLHGKRVDSTILLNGYWRSLEGTATGGVRLTIKDESGGRFVLGGAPTGVLLEGVYGVGTDAPALPVRLAYDRPLYGGRPLEIVVHRGGAQTADLPPASENSAEIIPYASLFGATGIEIDVRLTSDGVPVLFHDEALSERLIVKNGMVGPIENYSYAQLYSLVRLIRNGEHIPTLREALETVVTKTPIRFVWLDTKFHGDLQLLHSLQQEFMARAAALGKPLEILIGIPDQEVLDHFKNLPGYQDVPSVCELDPAKVQEANSRIWGPRWTLGLQNNEVAAVQAQGRRAFVWTIDLPENISLFVREGHFNGILTDYPTAVAYTYYVQR
ncbi:MAG: glycerophosphodiester phosphodiesterase [Sphingobacteriales bacterium]|nr:MAG: glycerophosphodiester phosphodiesterase [Sphingobacteriales bacterium]